MPQRVLDEDWSEYDNRRIRGGSDSRNFACTEPWEVDYLVRMIRAAYPQYSDAEIRNAIAHCCRAVGAPHPRPAFVECVMRRLRA